MRKARSPEVVDVEVDMAKHEKDLARSTLLQLLEERLSNSERAVDVIETLSKSLRFSSRSEKSWRALQLLRGTTHLRRSSLVLEDPRR